VRGLVVGICFALAALMLPFALVGVWVQRVVLDRDAFVDLSGDLLDEPAIRLALADSLTDELVDAGALPQNLQEPVDPVVAQLFTTPAVAGGFEVAMGQLYDQLDAGDETLVLDLSPALAAGTAELAAIDPRLAAAIPDGAVLPPIVVAQRDDVPLVWDMVDVARRIAVLAPIAVLALLGTAVAVARRHWLTLIAAGLTITAVSVGLLGLLTVTREVIAGGVSRVTASDAFAATWSVLQGSLTGQVALVAALGVVVAGAGIALQLVGRK
jgi:hypothetical protein